MNDHERAALVQQIADRIDMFCEHVGYGDPDITRDEAESYIEQIEEALLADRAPVPAVDAGAAPSLDDMLDSVHPKANVEARCISFPDDPVKWEAVVRVPIKGHVGYRSFRHDGPTRMAAIADAVAKARAQQKEGQTP